MNGAFPSTTIADLAAKGLVELQTGPFGTQLAARQYVEGGHAVINVRNIGDGRVRRAKLEYVDGATADRLHRHVLQLGDVVFARKGGVDRHALIGADEAGWVQGSDCIRLRFEPEAVDPRFFSMYCRQQHHREWMLSQGSIGATMPTLNHGIIGRIEFPLPGLSVQGRIADILSGYDVVVELNERRIALLEESMHLLYREWFERLRFPGYEWSPRSAGIPEGWSRGAIADVADLERRSVDPNETPNSVFAHYSFAAFDDGEMPNLETGDSIKSMKYQVMPGTVLVPKLNPHIPRVWVPVPDDRHPAISSSEYLVLRPKEPATQAFVAALCGRKDFLMMLAGRADGTSTSHRRIKPNDFMAQPCLVPSEEVLHAFDERVAPMLRLRHTLKLQSRKAKEARDYLVPRLMSGRTTV